VYSFIIFRPVVLFQCKYMLMSRKKAGQNHGIKIANRSFEGVAKFRYLGTTLQIKTACRKRLRAD
jgi:hypothetical protein